MHGTDSQYCSKVCNSSMRRVSNVIAIVWMTHTIPCFIKLLLFVPQECQRADWKQHKLVCGVGSPVKKSDWRGNLVRSWRKKNFYPVMAELARVMRQRNVTVQEVFVELDFMVREGVVPALQDPPEFKIKVVREFTEGSRSSLPDWFLLEEGSDEYEKEIQGQVQNMQICSEKIGDGELLVYSRFDQRNIGFAPIRLVETWRGNEVMLSSDYDDMIAFSWMIYGDGDSLLEKAAPSDVVHNHELSLGED